MMEMMHRGSRVSHQEIGSYFGGIDYTSVSHERSRIRNKLRDDATVKRSLRELKAAPNLIAQDPSDRGA
jgi:chromosomal replication initiation ATPase DnaA